MLIVVYFVGNIRNLAMEKVASQVMFPCKYSNSGCPITLQHTDKTDHEEICEFRYNTILYIISRENDCINILTLLYMFCVVYNQDNLLHSYSITLYMYILEIMHSYSIIL